MTMKSTKSVRRASLKRKQDLKKYIGRFAETEFGVDNSKVVEIDLTASDDEDDQMDEEDCTVHTNSVSSTSAALVRILCNMSASPPKWVAEAQRPYLVADSFSYNGDGKELSLSGYIRGQTPWDVNALVHIPNLGTFACRGVQKSKAPFAHSGVDESLVLSDPMKRESLDGFAVPDALQGEQNLVGFDEDIEEEDEEEEGNRSSSWLVGLSIVVVGWY